jgi:hypothetical protein
MKRSTSIQVGTYSNWVGSHYWSATENLADLPSATIRSLYNETPHGEFRPRLFVVDSKESIGPYPTISAEEPKGQFTVHRIDQQEVGKHPLRESILYGTTLGPVDFASFNYWTDFWENPRLPEFSLYSSESRNETQNKFWFEAKSIDWDETAIRRLIEATDDPIDEVRMMSDINTTFLSDSTSLMEYMRNCYSKSDLLILTSPIPHSDHMKHDHSIPSLVNLIRLNSFLDDIERSAIFLPRHQNDKLRIETTGELAVWYDSVCRRDQVSFGNQIETPYMTIDSHSFYAPLSPGEYGSLTPLVRTSPFFRNFANPTRVSQSSEIVCGSYGEATLVPFYQSIKEVGERFIREFKTVYHQYTETAELEAQIESLNNKIQLFEV